MKRSRRDFLKLASAGAIAAGLPLSPRVGRGQPAAKIGTAVLGDYAMAGPVIVALDRGYFKENGLNAEFIPFRGGPDLLKAVIGGEPLIGITGGTDIFVFREAGALIKIDRKSVV